MKDPAPQAAAASARQLVVLADGTNNNLTGRVDDTNVVKLAEWLAEDRRGAEGRLVFYDPGVGNPGELPGATVVDQIKRRIDRIAGLAFGRGVYENIADCYRFLMQNWRSGDRIFLLGFSRGAFTARSVAGLVNRFGILAPQHENLLPTLLHLYFSDDQRARYKLKIRAIEDQLCRLYEQPDSRRVHFVGVWDTVAAVGMWPFGLRMISKPRLAGKHFVHVRQALALDEHRLQFQPRLYAESNGSFLLADGSAGDVTQRWFPGAHCDVGGGYDFPHSHHSDQALAWLVSEAARCGLALRMGAAGVPPTEADLLAAMAPPTHSPQFDPYPAVDRHHVRSELARTPLWALTGMAVRDTTRWASDDGREIVVVGTDAAPRPEGLRSAWAQARPPAWVWWVMLLFGPLWLLVLGRCLVGADAPMHLLQEIEALAAPGALDRIGEKLRDFFVVWQLAGWHGLDWGEAAKRFASPRWALVADFVFIGLYASVLSWWAARAFGRLAGLRNKGDGARPGLNLLGQALLFAVAFDVLENLAGWLAWTLGPAGWLTLAWAAQFALALFTAAKLLSLAGVLVLIAWGSFKRAA